MSTIGAAEGAGGALKISISGLGTRMRFQKHILDITTMGGSLLRRGSIISGNGLVSDSDRGVGMYCL